MSKIAKEMEKILTQNYLRSKGFVRDETSAENVNRWHKQDGETHFDSTYYISITFSDMTGETAKYGIIVTLSAPHGYQKEKWSFEGETLKNTAFGPRVNIPNPITVDCFENILTQIGVR